ncbi:MAG: ORF2 protein [Anelloviridae sp.]|nr:MAG: ORF2 protein [Anelloviridae sp.]
MQEYKRKEAQWRKTCSQAHKLFCNCGEWWTHTPGWDTTLRGKAMGDATGEGISFLTFSEGTTSGEEDIIPEGGDTGIDVDLPRYFANISLENKNG